LAVGGHRRLNDGPAKRINGCARHLEAVGDEGWVLVEAGLQADVVALAGAVVGATDVIRADREDAVAVRVLDGKLIDLWREGRILGEMVLQAQRRHETRAAKRRV